MPRLRQYRPVDIDISERSTEKAYSGCPCLKAVSLYFQDLSSVKNTFFKTREQRATLAKEILPLLNDFVFILKADDGALAWMADVDADRPEEN